MAPRPWTVLKNDPIQKLEDNLWVVEGPIPGVPVHRRMAIARRQDGTLAFFNAVPVDDAALEELRAWGTPKYLVLPHSGHTIDADAFRKKLGLTVYGPAECLEKLAGKVEIGGPLPAFPEDPTVRLEGVSGAKNGEAVMIVRSAGGQRVSMVFADVIQNNTPGTMPWYFRPFFAAPRPKVLAVWRWQFLEDRAALKEGLLRWAETPNLHRIVPTHGAIMETEVTRALSLAAGDL